MPTPDCVELNNIFEEEAGRIGPELWKRTYSNDAWNGLVQQGPWPDGMGSILSSVVYNRATFAAAPVFTPIATSTTPTAADSYVTANLPFQKISVPKTRFQYQLQRANFSSDDIALEDLRFQWQVQDQVEGQLSQLSDATQSVFTDYRRREYTRLSFHKVIARTGLPENPTAFPVLAPTTPITQKILDTIYPKLNRDGASKYAYAQSSGKPIYTAIMSSEQHDHLLLENSEVRSDFRFSGDADKLLAPMGVANTYKGWFHIIDDFSPRWDLVGGAWVERSVYDADGEESALYDAAGYEDITIFLPTVFKELVPNVLNGVGKAVYKEAHSYRGEWFWLNIPDRNCNPFGNIGFFASVITTASKPGLIKHGWVIRVKRCPLDINPQNCTYGS